MNDSYWVDLGQGIHCELANMDKGIHLNPPILDWKGLEDKDGNEIPYSKEKAFEILDTHPDFAMLIYDYTGQRQLQDNTDKFDS